MCNWTHAFFLSFVDMSVKLMCYWTKTEESSLTNVQWKKVTFRRPKVHQQIGVCNSRPYNLPFKLKWGWTVHEKTHRMVPEGVSIENYDWLGQCIKAYDFNLPWKKRGDHYPWGHPRSIRAMLLTLCYWSSWGGIQLPLGHHHQWKSRNLPNWK